MCWIYIGDDFRSSQRLLDCSTTFMLHAFNKKMMVLCFVVVGLLGKEPYLSNVVTTATQSEKQKYAV